LDGLWEIKQAAVESGRTVITLFHKRADPIWAEAAARIRGGRYGHLQFGTASIQNPSTIAHGDYFASDMGLRTGPNMFIGTHFYDLLRYVTGLDPVSVRAHRFEGGAAIKTDIQMTNGASVSISSSWNLPAISPTLTKQAMTLHFSEGEIEIDATRRGYIEHSATGYSYINPYFMRSTPVGPVGYGASFLEEAVLSIAGVAIPSIQLPSIEDAWWATATAIAAQESSERDSSVEVRAPKAVA
jgi:predicted dehydrogenase